MAEEETTIIRKIVLSPYNGTLDKVIRLVRDLTPTEKIHLVLCFFENIDGLRFNETVELRELILQKNSNIHHLEVHDCFEFFIQSLLANNGETKHFLYCDNKKGEPMQLERASELSDAIRSNKNNNNNIESFSCTVDCDSSTVFQPVLEALLTNGVQHIKLFVWVFSKKNEEKSSCSNNLDFSSISTNTSLKELQLEITLYGTNLFDLIKGNKTLEKLIVSSRFGDAKLDDRGKKAFLEMLFNNTTLIHVELKDGNYNHILQEEINMHTTLNQIWKRLIIVKQKERMAAATTAATAAAIRSTATTNVAITVVDDATVERRMEQGNTIHEVEKMKKIAEEKKMMKKKKEMNLWLQTFEKKPVICHELIYLFLTENADIYNSNVTSSIDDGTERKGKRQKICYDLK